MTNEDFIKSISLDGEEWKDIEGYENRYMVSSFGRIASMTIEYDTYHQNFYQRFHRDPHLLKPTEYPKTKYLYFMVRKEGKRYKMLVHRVVANAFLVNPDNLPQVDHIDGNKHNNNVSNLRYCTAIENMANPITQQLVSKGRERANFPYRKKVVQLSNGIKIAEYDTIYSTRLAGFNHTQVNLCCKKTRKSHKGYQWMYLSDYENLVNKSKNVESANETI